MIRLVGLLPLCLVATLALGGRTVAQETTPVAELGPPSPAECQVEPRSPEEIAALGATPAARAATPEVVMPMTLPDGEPADAETVAALVQTVREVIACAEARDLPRLLALYSDSYITEHVLAAEPVPIIPGGPPEGRTLPATPPAAADRTPVVEAARLLPDGRAAARVTAVAPGSRVDIVLFVRVGERWLIDEVHPAAPPAATPPPERTPPVAIDDPVVQAVLADAAARLGIGASDLVVLVIEPREWPDTSLGCPKPDEFYAAVITPGYFILVAGAGQELPYHTDTAGRFVLCEQA